jgi:predicted Zn-dependent protease
MELAPPDSHHASAVIGWLELGNPEEARAEYEKINTLLRETPAMLELGFAVHAARQAWPDALRIAKRLLKDAPDEVSSWLHYAYALRRVPEGGLEAAWAALEPASRKFPTNETVWYNLACYAAQLGNKTQAMELLEVSLMNGERKEILARALRDEDLRSLWAELKQS